MSDEFYVGYQPKAPRDLRVLLRRVVTALTLLVSGTGMLLVMGQGEFAPSQFAYLDYRSHQGLLRIEPYPRLDGFWLVAQGKHGFAAQGIGTTGIVVALKGALIQNGPDRMLEVLPGSITHEPGKPPEPDAELGPASLVGEIVDSKCYFGAMNPGRGKVHRACAARCLSGGIPAGLLARDASGGARVIVLANAFGGPLSREVAHLAGERVRATGAMVRSEGSLILRVNLARIVRE